jgi:glycine oxidase
MKRPEVAIIGGGIIGLACAWSLARAGCRVNVLDAAREAREASWAAAGMLAPHHEAVDVGPLWRLGRTSLSLWPGFAAGLVRDVRDLDFLMEGGLLPVCDDADQCRAEHSVAFLAQQGISADWLSGTALAVQQPGLAANCTRALLLPGGQVNPRLVITALLAACAGLGVNVRRGTAVVGIERNQVVLQDGSRVPGEVMVLASGAWTPALAQVTGIPLAGEPVKGQMLRMGCADGALRRFIHCHHAYLVPRAGQGVVVGSTMVQSGFDKQEDPQAISALTAGARALLPGLAEAPVLETWTGLRPRLHSGLPLMSWVRPGLIVATGHFRNGVLLTPVTAALVTDLVMERQLPEELTPFLYPTRTNV